MPVNSSVVGSSLILSFTPKLAYRKIWFFMKFWFIHYSVNFSLILFYFPVSSHLPVTLHPLYSYLPFYIAHVLFHCPFSFCKAPLLYSFLVLLNLSKDNSPVFTFYIGFKSGYVFSLLSSREMLNMYVYSPESECCIYSLLASSYTEWNANSPLAVNPRK